jgi:prolyl oligopeptidase
MNNTAQLRWSLVVVMLLAVSCATAPKTAPDPAVNPGAVEATSQPAAPTGPAWAVGLPETARQPIVDLIHGQRVADPYRWLEDLKNPGARAWLTAQDRVARRFLSTLPGREALRKRLAELAYVDRTTAPLRRGERFFYERQHADKEKMVYYWRQGEQGQPNVLIDPNTLSDDGSISVHGVFVSYDGRRAAYKLSENNADESTLHLREVQSGKDSKTDTIVGAKYAYPSWNRRGNGFYYTRLPVDPSIEVSERPGHAAIYYHRLGQDPKKDRLVHPKTGDPRTFIHADLSRDGRFVFVYIYHGWTRTDVYFKDLRRRDKKFRPFVVGRDFKYEATAWMGKIYVHTDDGAPNYRLFVVDPRKIERDAWKEIVAERSDAVLKSFAVRGNHLSLHYLRQAATQLRIATLDGKPVREVELPGIGSSRGLVGNPEAPLSAGRPPSTAPRCATAAARSTPRPRCRWIPRPTRWSRWSTPPRMAPR